MKDKLKVKEYNKQYYEKNKEILLPKIRKRVKEWAKNNKEHRNNYFKAKRVLEKQNLGNTKNSEYNKKSRLKLKIEVIEKMGGKCNCCGESEIEFLTIDHINNNGAEDRKINIKPGGCSSFRYVKSNNYPPDFQLLCFNCNYSRFLGKGICIHKRQNV